jgi:hypothetical protein
VSGLGDRGALNVYLVDLRENRRLRSNERLRTVEEGYVFEEPAPARLDCHYLVSAWSPASATPAVEPALDEHDLLYRAAAVLLRAAPLVPAVVYPAGSLPLAAWPERFRDVELPLVVAPPEGFAKLSEFWQSMGGGARWKPVLHIVLTVPVALVREVSGPIVTTRITEYRLAGRPETAEVWVQIGGAVLDPGGAAVAGAWVALEALDGERLRVTHTDEQGRFTFGDLRVDRYRLRARASGLGERTREVEMPAETGGYDLRFV